MFPFVKWAGGKRQLLPTIKENLPRSFHTYYEPFVGGGAVLFDLKYTPAIINDVNTELIHTYQIIKSNPIEIFEVIKKLDSQTCNNSLYNLNRTRFNQKITKHEYDIELAALFIWINKHCFNGLYRVNRSGKFNVPYNGAGNIESANLENILEISKYLQTVTILNEDFETVCKTAHKNDFIFFDSPYDNSFTSYAKNGFSVEDHRRLAELFQSLTDRGCFCMLTNHNTELIQKLYKDFKIQEISVRRSINRNGNNRSGTEIIITNY